MTTGPALQAGPWTGPQPGPDARATSEPDVLVEVRYFAAAAEAAGCDGEHVPLRPGTTVGDLLDALGDRHGPALADVAARCALLVDGVLHRDRDRSVGTPARVDVLPPFAGG